jgi:glycosyltransferase involved in cell wall biosynthesis
MKQPLVSVIIPFYKGKEWLEEALDSVKQQTYKNLEIILINDGSNEDISYLISNDINYYEQNNKGVSSARNIGIGKSTGEFIAFLDSDDLWEKNKIQIQLNEMLKKQYIWSHTNYVKFGEKNYN